jgi:2-desacetyl-2-hydroxyethyl bacteriochlorophyllide A dehydrogenase
MQRRATAKRHVARAIWYVKPGVVELRAATLPPLAPTDALVRMLFSGISRGTERLVLSGLIGPSEWERMRAPAQDGQFPFPVKYGYCATGLVEDGPADLIGRTVFALHPHQDRFVIGADRLTPVPDAVPARRATLAANMETALNAHWDGRTGPADCIVVIGAGVVGLLVAYIAARLPGAEVWVIDVDPSRRVLAERLGARFATPQDVPSDAREADVVFHTSAQAAGLDLALQLAGLEATIVELSWYGDRPATVNLGGAFHSRRLRLVSSQVGKVSAERRARWSYRRRLDAALALLADDRLDALVAEEIAFNDAPVALPLALAANAKGLAPVICYP